MAKPILIDITRLIFRLLKGKRATGVDRVGLAYVAHYQALYGERVRAVLSWRGRVGVLSPAESAQVFRQLLHDNQHGANVWFWRKLLLKLSSFRRPDQAYAGSIFFNTGHKGVESPEYVATLRAMGVKPVYFVHDLIPLTYPEYCRPDEEAKHADRMTNMLTSGAALLVNSDDTKREMEAFAASKNLPVLPIQTAWLASGLDTDTVGKTAASAPAEYADRPYFVALSTIEARKNHLLLLQIWRRMVEQLGEEQVPRLIIIGQRGWECEQTIDLLERAHKLKNVVVELNGVSDAQLSSLLAHARALLFPSFTEGFGMPLVEALELGVPVIASDIPVFQEIGQAIPDFADPVDGLGWYRLVLDYARPDSPERAAQMARMQAYRPWGWPDHFQQVDAFLQQTGLLD